MLNAIKVLALLAYSVLIFIVSDFIILGVMLAVNIAIMFIVRLRLKKVFVFILGVLPFIFFASLINVFLGDNIGAALVAIRLLLACTIVLIFSQLVTSMQLANGIETLCYPLKIAKVEPKDIGLMVCIAITFIPILVRDFNQIKRALQAKGMPVTARNLKFILKPFLYGIFKRTEEISSALLAKAYS